MAQSEARRLFGEMASRPDGEVDLAEAALLIAEEEYPGLDRSRYLGALDELARAAARRTGGETEPHAIVNALSDYLFEEVGFHANESEYYDPRNSFLNEVLDRRLGIPITLSLVYSEVARRLRLPVVGVGMPGHFVVKFVAPHEEIIIDPFHRGLILTREDCARLVEGASGGVVQFRQEHLAAVSRKGILTRILNNLKGIYLRQKDLERALGVVERLLLVNPDSLSELRDRGLIRYRLRDIPAAIADLETYLERAPGAGDFGNMSDLLRELRRLNE